MINWLFFSRLGNFWSRSLSGFCARAPTDRLPTASRAPEIGPAGFGVDPRTRSPTTMRTTTTRSAPATTASIPATFPPSRPSANETHWSSERRRVNDAAERRSIFSVRYRYYNVNLRRKSTNWPTLDNDVLKDLVSFDAESRVDVGWSSSRILGCEKMLNKKILVLVENCKKIKTKFFAPKKILNWP